MNIILKTEAAPDGEKLNIKEGMTIEDLAKVKGPFQYDILLARLNGRDTDLTEQLKEGDSVALLDMRNQSANLTYQRSLTFIYLMAVNEVFGRLGIEGADAEIDNSLNKGFFTRVRPSRFHSGTKEDAQEEIQQKLTDEVVREIEDRMREIVEMDIPFHKSLVSAEEGIRIWKEGGYDEKVKLLEEIVESEPDFMPAFFTATVPSTLPGGEEKTFTNFFFGPMVPSSGYIKRFELRKYRKGILLRYPYYSDPNTIPEYVDDNKMYGAFSEEHRWLHILGTRHLSDMNDLVRKGGAKDTILLSEALHEKKIAEIADDIKSKRRRIVLIAGRAHTKHTEGGDFRQATYRAVRQGLMKARSVILEPWYEFVMELAPSRIGRAMADVERMQGSFEAPESDGTFSILKGRAPVSAMRGYQKEFLSYTGGEGRFTCTTAGYYPCHDPASVWEEMAYDPMADPDNTPDSVFCSHGAGFLVPWYATEKYMHLPGAGLPDYSGMTGQDFDWYDDADIDGYAQAGLQEGNLYSPDAARNAKEAAQRRRSRETGYAGEDELRAIFERTYGPAKTRVSAQNTVIKAGAPAEYVWKEKPKKRKKEEFLLVDGYNIIFSWEELRSLASHDIAAARDTLLDRMSDYQGYTGVHVIVVFDAYKVQGFKGEVLKWHNISVVFTKEAETADQYIEKTAHVMAKNCRVTVATSDGTEQVIIRSEGCLLLSATDLHEELARVKKESRQEREEEVMHSGTYLGEKMPDFRED